MIDLVFTSMPKLFTELGCEEVALSDHGLIYGIVPDSVKKLQQGFQFVRCWNKCDVEAILSDLDEAPWSVMESFDDIDDRWGYWKSLFLKIFDSHIPLRKVHMRAQTLPWISNDVRWLMRVRNNSCARAKKSKKADDWMRYRSLRNKVAWELKKAKLQYFDKMSGQSSKKAWRELNQVLGRKGGKGIEAVQTPNGRLTDRQDIVGEFSKFFHLGVGYQG